MVNFAVLMTNMQRYANEYQSKIYKKIGAVARAPGSQLKASK
jgi:hypothetical protein